ncbi:MAG: ABC transporter ATP-binding protein [Oscillospiraceae bacterium]
MENVLKTSGVTKIYAGKPAVNNVSMTIKKGDIYGFIGKNGAGKTTLIRMITGIAKQNSGEIEILESKDLNFQRSRIGSIIEYPSVYPNMTAAQNLEQYRILLGIPDKNCVQEILKTVDLTDTGKKKAGNFSLGMKQRLGIGIALLGNPDFLILDEPINGLDPSGIKNIRELILKLNKENGITFLISSHILGELAKIATCYGIINNGILVDEFSKEQLELRCKRCLKVKVDNAKKAAVVLETVLKITNYDVLSDNDIRIFDMLDEAEKVNAVLIKNDVSVKSISAGGQDLEGYFMELMEEQKNA